MSSLSREKSRAVFDQAQRWIPGGVNSPARAFGAVGGSPVVIERGKGAYLFDVDGQRYIDYVGSWGPMILGHVHPQVTQKIQDAVLRGSSFGASGGPLFDSLGPPGRAGNTPKPSSFN